MPLTVHIEQDDALHVDVFAVHVVGELRQRGVGAGVVDVVAPRHLLDVLVLGDDPVAAVVEAALADFLLAPPDGRGRAQLGQLVDREPHDVAVRVQEIETRWNVRAGPGTRHGDALLNMT